MTIVVYVKINHISKDTYMKRVLFFPLQCIRIFVPTNGIKLILIKITLFKIHFINFFFTMLLVKVLKVNSNKV